MNIQEVFCLLTTHLGVNVSLMLRRVFVLSVLILWQVGFCQAPSVAVEAEVMLDAEAQARQVRIYREALNQGSSEEIRVDAAVGLLLQNTAESRGVLLAALKSDENVPARSAVCKALVRSRGLSQKIESIEVFREPLLSILQNQSGPQAKLAAESLLLFESDEILTFLQAILDNQDLPATHRINAVYALQLRPEPAALRGLIELLDSPDKDVSKAAETALQEAFGIPVGTGRKVWSDILAELQLKSPEEIRKERLLRQEMKLRDVQTERDRWQKLYLVSLDKHYDPLDETGRTAMILEMMDSDLSPVRLWALDKAAKYPVVGDSLRDRILRLLTDPSRDVRLQTAKVLMNMSALNPAAALLAQFEQEKDAEVRLAMFEALGEAVFFAFLPDSKIELSSEIKGQTLSIAADYLQSESAAATIKGAEVVRKIIELNKLEKNLMQGYLELLYGRYQKSLTQGGNLRADLLGILARLCGQGGAKAAACALFEPLFVEALAVKDNPALRLAAAQGLSYVDKVKALELFKRYTLTTDENLAVKHVVIEVAGQAGGDADLGWLLEALSNNGHSEYAWDAIKNICQRQDPVFLLEWLDTLEAAAGIKDEYVREILDIAEQKAIGAKHENVLKKVQERTILWFLARKEWENGVAYLGKINFPQTMGAGAEAVTPAAVEIYMRGQAWEALSSVIQNKLASVDFGEAFPGASLLEQFFESPDVSSDAKQAFFKALAAIKPDNRPGWQQFVDKVDQQLNGAAPAEPPLSAPAAAPASDAAVEKTAVPASGPVSASANS
jgi:HEAT repeat protein